MRGNFAQWLLAAVSAAVLVATGPVGAEASGRGQAPEVSEKLPGTYRLVYRGGLISLEAVKSYHPCGRYESVGKARLLGIEKKLVHRGRWAVEDGQLVYVLSESSTPKEAPVGVPLRFRLLDHDGRTLTYRDEAREKTYAETRVGEAGS